MTVAIATIEPKSARSGDTWQWSRSFADYPAPTWVLTYTLFNAATKVSIVAAADGTEHAVTVSAATTANYTAGRYEWIASVASGSERYQIDAGVIDILPNVAALSKYDGRSHARIMLDAIEALLESRASSGDLDLVMGAFSDRRLQYDMAGLRKLRQEYAAIVASEDMAAARARGEKAGMVQVRFR